MRYLDDFYILQQTLKLLSSIHHPARPLCHVVLQYYLIVLSFFVLSLFLKLLFYPC